MNRIAVKIVYQSVFPDRYPTSAKSLIPIYVMFCLYYYQQFGV